MDQVIERGIDPGSLDRVVLNYVHLVEGDSKTVRAEQRDVFEDLFDPSRGFAHAEEHCLVGTIDEVVERLQAYEEIGFEKAIAGPAASDPKTLDRQLDLLVNRVLPLFE